MTLPSVFSSFLTRVSEPFGGSEVVSAIVPERDLEFIATYPGFISIVQPWASEINLLEYGFELGTRYTIHNSDYQQLYSKKSDDGYYGRSDKEKILLTQVRHGSYLLISFENERELITGLLWVCNKINPYTVKQTIQAWEKQSKVLESALDQHEIYINTSFLRSSDFIDVYFVPGSWSQNYDSTEIKNHPSTTVSRHKANSILTLYPRQTGWYLFELTRDNRKFLLVLKDLKGPSSNRIRPTIQGSYFIQLKNISGVNKRPVRTLLPSLAKPVTRALDTAFIHLEATFDLIDKLYSIGTSTVDAISSVIRTSYVIDLTGSSSISSDISFIFNSEIEANSEAESDSNTISSYEVIANSEAESDSNAIYYLDAELNADSMARVYTKETIEFDLDSELDANSEAEITNSTKYKTFNADIAGSASQ